MDCRKSLILISPYLDGELAGREIDALRGHVSGCEACRNELALQERLKAALRAFGREEFEAPPELCGIVMGSIRESRTTLRRLPASWRRIIAAAASILMLAGGSAGVITGLKIAGNGSMIGFKSTAPGIDGGAYAPGNTAGGASGENGLQPTGAGEIGNTGPGGGDANPGKEAGPSDRAGSGGLSSGDTAGKVLTAAASPPAGEKRVLLSSGVLVTSTNLKMEVDDLARARARAVSIAAGAGAATQVFPEQSGGEKVLVLRVVADSAGAPGLISGLTGMGTVVSRQDETRDLTNHYNEILVQSQDIQSRIITVTDPGERNRLEAQYASYRQELDAMSLESGKRVIVLWLES